MTKEQNRKKLTKGKKILLIILCCFLSVILLISTTLASLYFYGKKLSTSKDVVITPTDNILADIDDDNIVTYNGKKYKYNEDITTVLCVGVDNAKLQKAIPTLQVRRVRQMQYTLLLLIPQREKQGL